MIEASPEQLDEGDVERGKSGEEHGSLAGLSESEIESLRALVRTVMSASPGEYPSVAARARAVKSAVVTELTGYIGPALNLAIEARPQNSLMEQRALAAWVNYELRSFGMAIRLASGSAPGILTANPSRSAEDDGGCFRVESRDASGVRKRSSVSRGVPMLELVEDPPRAEGGSRYRP